jgi:hypothetical protein
MMAAAVAVGSPLVDTVLVDTGACAVGWLVTIG